MYYNPLDELQAPQQGQAGQARQQIDIYVRQRNAKKRITLCTGLPRDLDYAKVLAALKRANNCTGAVKEKDGVQQLVLSGDQRAAVQQFLVAQQICAADEIKVHGY
jgi:translation initiation factor SUI1